MADLKCRIGTLLKLHRATMCTVICTYLMCASWHIKAMLQYRFQTLERKPRPWSQSYIRPTSVVPDTMLFPSPHPLSSPSHVHVHGDGVVCQVYDCSVSFLHSFTRPTQLHCMWRVRKAIMTSYRHCWEQVLM